jgi:hypothetical protein
VVVGYANAQAGAAHPTPVRRALGQPGALAQMLDGTVRHRWCRVAAVLLATAGQRRAPASRQALRRPSTWGWTLLVATLIVLGSNGIAFLAKQLGVEPVPTNWR